MFTQFRSMFWGLGVGHKIAVIARLLQPLNLSDLGVEAPGGLLEIPPQAGDLAGRGAAAAQ